MSSPHYGTETPDARPYDILSTLGLIVPGSETGVYSPGKVIQIRWNNLYAVACTRSQTCDSVTTYRYSATQLMHQTSDFYNNKKTHVMTWSLLSCTRTETTATKLFWGEYLDHRLFFSWKLVPKLTSWHCADWRGSNVTANNLTFYRNFHSCQRWWLRQDLRYLFLCASAWSD